MTTETAELLKPQLHVSGLNMLNRCGIQFEFRYMKRIIAPPGVSLIVGSATDSAVNKNLTAKKDTGALLPIEEVKQEAADSLSMYWNAGVALNEDEAALGNTAVKGQAIDKAVTLSALHADRLAPIIEPTHVQWPWSIQLKGYPVDLAGTVDVREKIALRDTKTTGKSPDKNAAHTSPQLTAYALAVRVIDGAAPEYVALDFLVANKVAVAKTMVSKRDNEDFQMLLRRVENASKIIESGNYTPANPTDWFCDERWCGYATQCPYYLRPKLFQLGAPNE